MQIQDGAVRVDTPNPLYGNDPYTVQPGGCKDPGQYIHVTKDFLVDLNTTSEQNYGYVGIIFKKFNFSPQSERYWETLKVVIAHLY